MQTIFSLYNFQNVPVQPYKVTKSSFCFQIVSIPNQLSNSLKETTIFPFLHFKKTLIILNFFLLFSVSHNNWGPLNCFFDHKEKNAKGICLPLVPNWMAGAGLGLKQLGTLKSDIAPFYWIGAKK